MKNWVGVGLFLLAQSSFAYLNGVPTSDNPAAAAYRINGKVCNGTFVLREKNELEALITSGHCLEGASRESLIVLAYGGKVGTRAVGFWRIEHPVGHRMQGIVESDIGFVLFPAGTAEEAIPISPTPLSPGAGVFSSSWHPKGGGKYGSENEIFSYNLRDSDKSVVGYILSEEKGGVPNLDGESGTGLISERGLIGVSSGTLDLSLIDSTLTGTAAVFMSVHPQSMIAQLAQAKRQFPGPFASLDLDSFLMFKQGNASPLPPAPLPRSHPPRGNGPRPLEQATSPVVSVSAPVEEPLSPAVPRPAPLSFALKKVVGSDRQPKKGSARIELKDSLE